MVGIVGIVLFIFIYEIRFKAFYDDLFLLSLAERLVDFEGVFDFERVLDLDTFLLGGAFEETNLELSTNTIAPGTNIHTPFGKTYKRKSVKLSLWAVFLKPETTSMTKYNIVLEHVIVDTMSATIIACFTWPANNRWSAKTFIEISRRFMID